MTKLQILLISFLTFLTSRAKSFKESSFDNENSSQNIEVTPYGLVNDRESITIYLKSDDVLSISEFNKFYNPEQHYQTNFRFIKETDSDYVKKEDTENNKIALENSELKEHTEETNTEKNVDATIVDSKEDSSENKSEISSTETNEIKSTTVEGQTSESTEGYENDLESPEHIESTESYFKLNVSNNDTNSDKQDDIMNTIPLRRSFLPNEKLLLDNKGEISNTSVEIANFDQDTFQKSDTMSLEKPNDQSEVESTSETPSMAAQKIDPQPFIPQKQFNNLTPLPAIKRTGPAVLSEISNEDTNVERLKITPDVYKQSNNLDKPKEISKNWKTIEDYNSNIYENAYLFTPTKVNSMSEQSLANKPNFNSLYSKLTQASENPFRNRLPVRQHFGNYGAMPPYFNLQNPYLQNFGPYNFVRRTRRYSIYNNCCQNKHKLYRN